MLEEKEDWRRGGGSDKIENVAEMRSQRRHAGFDSDPLYAGLYNLRWRLTPEKTSQVRRQSRKAVVQKFIFASRTAASL